MKLWALALLSGAMRLAMLAYGEWQDENGARTPSPHFGLHFNMNIMMFVMPRALAPQVR